MIRRLRDFGRNECGAARTQAGFAIAAATGVAGIALFLLLGGAPPPPPPAPSAPAEVALGDLMAGQIRQFSPAQVQSRLDTYLDPSDRTDAQLRNAHRIWAERVGDPRYGDQDLAHDMFVIIDRAMQIRGVAPHPPG